MTPTTYWHRHPRNFANECIMYSATTQAECDQLDAMNYEQLTRDEALAEIKLVNRENDDWGSNRAFEPMSLAEIENYRDSIFF